MGRHSGGVESLVVVVVWGMKPGMLYIPRLRLCEGRFSPERNLVLSCLIKLG